jgi:Uma2 family endonuclease
MTTQSKPRRMTVAEFLDWAAAQPRGRYELVRGEVVAMAPERVRHSLTKLAVAVALRDAVKRAALPCTVFPDGMTIVFDNEHSREPDAAVQCGVAISLDSTVLEAPLIVVEITSPSSERDDTGEKLVEYFSVPSIHHYLIVNPAKSRSRWPSCCRRSASRSLSDTGVGVDRRKHLSHAHLQAAYHGRFRSRGHDSRSRPR